MANKDDSNTEIDKNLISDTDENLDTYVNETFTADETMEVDSTGNFDIDPPALAQLAQDRALQPSDMKAWLAQYKLKNRSSTVTGAFVAALLPHDEYDEQRVEQAMVDLEQNGPLTCVYCGGAPTTWDHLTNSVQNRKANGPGHRVYNLVPSCASCNSSKGGKSFNDWILGYTNSSGRRIPGTGRVRDDRREQLVQLLSAYQKKCPPRSAADIHLEAKLMEMRDRVLAILNEADELVANERLRD